MLTDDGLRVIEYNARFGDPETQALLPLVDENLVEVLAAAAAGTLGPGRIAMRPLSAVTVVAAAEGYPGAPRSGGVLRGLDRLDDGVQCFHAGTQAEGSEFTVSGGRVLAITAVAADVDAARALVYANLEKIAFDGMWYRRDIALQPAEVSL